LHKVEACVQQDTCMYHVAWRNKHLQTIGVVTWSGRSEHCLLLIKYNTCRDVWPPHSSGPNTHVWARNRKGSNRVYNNSYCITL